MSSRAPTPDSPGAALLRSWRLGWIAPSCVGAACALVVLRPDLLARRFVMPGASAPYVDAGEVTGTLSRCLALLGLTFVLFTVARRGLGTVARWPLLLAVGGAFLLATYPLAGWLIDDAAITFAYSENLATGHGLRLHPSHPPEEGYSNLLWLLMITLPRLAGIAQPISAKILGLGCGIACVWLVLHALARLRSDDDDAAPGIAILMCFGAPFLVWSASGLEHPLQALLLLGIAVAPLYRSRPALLQGCLFGALMLLRPEIPLLVTSVAVALLLHAFLVERGVTFGQMVVRLLPLGLPPVLALTALLTFRMAYFGDPLPNPFYAKAAEASFARVLNVFGGGWDYLLSWLTTSAVVMVVPFGLALDWRRAPLPIWLGCAVVAGQAGFILYAGGDWMGCWRFVAPLVPVAALVAGWGVPKGLRGVTPSARALAIGGMTVLLLVSSVKQYHRFLLQPTTPFSVVASIGMEFKRLANRLGIAEPRLAYHDAGGSTYTAALDLVDLAGLGNREIAMHITDAEFLSHYVVEEKRPLFVFGAADNFAARSGFHLRKEFSDRYVRLEFPGKPLMKAGLCHIRRDVIRRDVLDVVEEDGRVVRAIVKPE